MNFLRMLLATKVFLFCGVSFSDPDLLSLMDEAKSLYGEAFGPHFAIFPERFFDPDYSAVLNSSYNIKTLVAPNSCNTDEYVDATTLGVAADWTPGYATHRHDTDTPLVHMIGRVYDPESGRFTTPEAIVAMLEAGKGKGQTRIKRGVLGQNAHKLRQIWRGLTYAP